jgi:hypothetical protein
MEVSGQHDALVALTPGKGNKAHKLLLKIRFGATKMELVLGIQLVRNHSRVEIWHTQRRCSCPYMKCNAQFKNC